MKRNVKKCVQAVDRYSVRPSFDPVPEGRYPPKGCLPTKASTLLLGGEELPSMERASRRRSIP
jgi:hypothetical protein